MPLLDSVITTTTPTPPKILVYGTPGVGKTTFAAGAGALLLAELGAPVLRYNVPALYPRLYDVEYRFDSGHLSAEGADYFSRLLARDVAALTRDDTGAKGCLRQEDAQ